VITRLRVGGVTLAVRAAGPTAAIALPKRCGPFVPGRGADIALRLELRPPPTVVPSDLLFDSGGTWRVYRRGQGLLYLFRPPMGEGPPARAVAIDALRRRGTLYLPASSASRSRGFALSYPLDELLFQHHVARAGGLVVHACGVASGGRAVLFCGRSGAGKTTTARLFRRHHPEAVILSDDRIVLRRQGSGWRAFGTPWHGSGRFASPASCRLAAVIFLEQGQSTRVRPLAVTQVAARLFAQSFPPVWEGEGTACALEAAARVAEGVPGYVLRFRPDRSAVRAALGVLAGSHGWAQGHGPCYDD
jgi:hypothetical protein